MTPLSKNARAAGLLYILSLLFGVVRLIDIPNTLIVHGNASATANNYREPRVAIPIWYCQLPDLRRSMDFCRAGSLSIAEGSWPGARCCDR